MRYSLLSFLTSRNKKVIFQPAQDRQIFNIGFIRDNVPINKYKELASGIILGKSNFNNYNEPVVFIPENHYLFNMPSMDSKVDFRMFDKNLDAMNISLQFTSIVRKEIGIKNFNNLTQFIRGA